MYKIWRLRDFVMRYSVRVEQWVLSRSDVISSPWRLQRSVDSSQWRPVERQCLSVLLSAGRYQTTSAYHVCRFSTAHYYHRHSGGASAVKEPGHLSSENLPARSPGCTFFLKKSWRFFLVVTLKTQAANAVSPSK